MPYIRTYPLNPYTGGKTVLTANIIVLLQIFKDSETGYVAVICDDSAPEISVSIVSFAEEDYISLETDRDVIFYETFMINRVPITYGISNDDWYKIKNNKGELTNGEQ